MASLYRRPSQSRDGIFWIAFYHPKTGRLIRRSLNTTQRARAERLRAHVQALCKADSPSAPVLSSALKVLLRDESGVYASTDSGSANSPMGGKSLPGAVFPSLEEKPAMPSIYPRPADAENPVYWVALYHPLTGAQIRKSLETRNREEAARRACRIEALCTMVSTQTIEVPDGILDAIGARDLPLTSTIVAQAPSSPASTPRRCTVEEALRSLLATMLVGNDGGYLANTLCNARALFGSNLVARVDPRKEKPSDGRQAPLREAGIAVVYLDEITSQMLAVFLAKQGWAMDTCRHYKEFIRRLFNHALASGLHLPTNPHAPNPSAGLSSFIDTERDIVVLTPEEEQAQLAAVAKDWRILAGIKIMLGTGLRLHEMLSIRPEDLLLDKCYLRLLKNRGRATGSTPCPNPRAMRRGATLKRGERTVALEKELLDFFPPYLERLRSKEYEWIVPSPSGIRWTANAFGKRLHELNATADLDFTSQHFRSTYATRRIAERWPLRVLARQMGTSVKMLEQHYGGYIPPEALVYCK